MPMSSRPLLRLWTLVLATLLATALAPAAQADRPSLIDLQGTVDQLVDGLCDGDAATCGAPPPPAASGALVFEPGPGEISLGLVDIGIVADVPVSCTLSCVPAGAVSFSSAHATLLHTSAVATLSSYLITSQLSQRVEVVLPSDGTVLSFDNVRVQTLSSAEVPGRVTMEFVYENLRFDWQGTSSEWNLATHLAKGCTIPSHQMHVELAGNDPSSLQAGEIGSVYLLGLLAAGANTRPSISFTRTPPDACYLRGASTAQSFDVDFERLWESDDQFAGRQAIETLGLTNAFADRYELRIESGTVTEETILIPQAGMLTTREFSPVDGSQTAGGSTSF